MKPIVTLTPNPTIDGAASAEVIRPLHKIRTSDERYHPGGGGINVARVIHALGKPALAVYPAGGPTGAILDELLATARLETRRIAIAGYTRIAHTVFERSSGLEYRFVPEGPLLSAGEWDRCIAALAQVDWEYIVASGSLARGLEPEAYHRVIDVARAKGARVILDTSGPALRAALERGVYFVKPSLGELESLVGHALPDAHAQASAARDLVDRGCAHIVAVTLGRDGAMIVSAEETWHLAAPPVTARSAVGAGDSFLAAAVVALSERRSLAATLAYGVAAGAAAVLSPGNDLASADDVEQIYAGLQSAAGAGEASSSSA
ncbi:1-phosphofructokinase family hexose kinase [Sphingomonas canadensis]|uniref:Phosphofructokinase n=1 Tax=Sphingomonas canadensis TaxID=1219257 RepID=A0ABW3H7H0_9SPHN|nr:1-phosphofructokinase family hexose kinase [Sphingomonas canadensis]MCW3837319.1 1-phosphofructokinase family hexose kinase [Sphingomonas canadensis]